HEDVGRVDLTTADPVPRRVRGRTGRRRRMAQAEEHDRKQSGAAHVRGPEGRCFAALTLRVHSFPGRGYLRLWSSGGACAQSGGRRLAPLAPLGEGSGVRGWDAAPTPSPPTPLPRGERGARAPRPPPESIRAPSSGGVAASARKVLRSPPQTAAPSPHPGPFATPFPHGKPAPEGCHRL